MSQQPTLSIDWIPPTHGAKGIIAVSCGDEDLAQHIDIDDPADRARVGELLTTRWPGLPREEIQERLESAAKKSTSSGDSKAAVLATLMDRCELFHTPGGYDSEGMATIRFPDHLETWPVESKGFGRWLAREYYEMTREPASSNTLQDMVNLFGAKAIHEGQQHQVAVRVAESGGAIYVDLANDAWETVKVTPKRWEILRGCDVPVRFLRKSGTLPLPTPVSGGSVDELREFINLPDDDSWKLVIGWMLMALRPRGPYPILVVNGEQGSAKTTLCRMVRSLIDPNAAPLRRPPKDEHDLMIAAKNSHVLGFDNLSGIRVGLSDALCCLSTGGGFATRRLYTNEEEVLFQAMRPVMMNGISDLATRADLLDRCEVLRLSEIPESRRVDERTLWERFEEARPRIFGAILDALSVALRRRSSVVLPYLPRMADFAIWGTAAEPALGWEPGDFVCAYSKNRGEADALVLEASSVGPAIAQLVEKDGTWKGTASDLLSALEEIVGEETRRRRDWPKEPRGMRAALDRIAPTLRRRGIEAATFREPGGQRRRLISLETTSIARNGSPDAATPNLDVSEGRDDRDGRDGQLRNLTPLRGAASTLATFNIDSCRGRCLSFQFEDWRPERNVRFCGVRDHEHSTVDEDVFLGAKEIDVLTGVDASSLRAALESKLVLGGQLVESCEPGD